MIRFLFSTGSLWSYSIERCFLLAKEAGFDGLELVVDHRWDSRQEEYLNQLVERSGLPLLAIHSPFIPNVPGWPNDQPSRIQWSIELAKAVGANVVVHHLPTRIGFAWVQYIGRRFFVPMPTNPEGEYRRWIEGDYRQVQSSNEVKLCIENMPAYRRFGRRWNYCHWNTPFELARFSNITLDTTHLGSWNLDPLEVYTSLVDRVRHIHLSNYNGREHQRPENGNLRLDLLLRSLVSHDYAGHVTLELLPEALDAGGPDDRILDHLRSSLAYCRQFAVGE
jgi:sugar phosphate isomerase/epimerase